MIPRMDLYRTLEGYPLPPCCKVSVLNTLPLKYYEHWSYV
jgi:hypothetical protein